MKTSPSLVHHFLERSASRYSEKLAVVHQQYRADYLQINAWANKLAHYLLEEGVASGERIAVLCENSMEYICCYYGVLKAGGIFVSLNTELRIQGLTELLKELEPRAMIISPKYAKIVRMLDLSLCGVGRLLVIGRHWGARSVGDGFSLLPAEAAAQPDRNPGLSIDPISCAAIIYTSGSAGKPKGVMLSHANIVANTQSIIRYLKLTSRDVQMVVLPFFYVMGKSLLNTHFAVGGTVVLNNHFAYTASVLRQMAEEKVTGFSGVPSTYAYLLFKSPLQDYRDKLPDLRYCSQAGGHMPSYVKKELVKRLPSHTKLYVMYGATEASARLAYVPPDRLESKWDSIGIPIPGVTLKVMSSEGRALGPGKLGELVAQGANIMLGYYKNAEATKRVLDSDGYHTGDIGYVDKEGFFYINGRKDDQIKIGGHRLNPQEIEDVVIESGQAAECAIFTIDDAIMGHKLAGLVVPIQESSETARIILNYCTKKLPKYKVPGSLLTVEAIPKNSNGKPDRLKSRELFTNNAGKKTRDHV